MIVFLPVKTTMEPLLIMVILRPRQFANDALRNYTKQDSRYVAVGGETCDDTFSPQNDCEASGRAQTEMRGMHYSYLNCAYNNAVNNDWQTGGCMDKIKKELGYRFILKDGTYPASVKPGSSFTYRIHLANEGYAAPFNPRPVRLILRKQGDQAFTSLVTATNARTWLTGANIMEGTVSIPAVMTSGKYDLLLSLPDAYAPFQSVPSMQYALQIRTAGRAPLALINCSRP